MATNTFTTNGIFPLTSSILFERPYLSICRNNQKKKKPQFSKLSILTKSSIGSTKVTSNEYKRHKQEIKTIQKNASSHHVSLKDKKRKGRSNSYKQHKMGKAIKVQRLGLSYEPEDFGRIQKQTPLSRTVYKKQQINSISPLYSSLIFNSVQEHQSPFRKNKQLSQILDRTFHVLSEYKQQCQNLKKQRDIYKKKYNKASSIVKKLQRTRYRDRF